MNTDERGFANRTMLTRDPVCCFSADFLTLSDLG